VLLGLPEAVGAAADLENLGLVGEAFDESRGAVGFGKASLPLDAGVRQNDFFPGTGGHHARPQY
jgi:hypothetical protein